MFKAFHNSDVVRIWAIGIIAAIGFTVLGCGPTKAELDAKARRQLEVIDDQISESKARPMTDEELPRITRQLKEWEDTLTPAERQIYDSNDEEAIRQWFDENPQKEVSLWRAWQP